MLVRSLAATTLALAIGPVFAQTNVAGIDAKNFDAGTAACLRAFFALMPDSSSMRAMCARYCSRSFTESASVRV